MEEEEGSFEIIDVWEYNLEEEFEDLRRVLCSHPVISVDTEFPGFLRCTPRDATESSRFEDLWFNVTPTKLIQLGLTLSDYSGNVYRKTWQFNFLFNSDNDVGSRTSIEFLRNSADFDFDKFRKDGIRWSSFSLKFAKMVSFHRARRNLLWVTFHGSYDLAHILKLLTRMPLPFDISHFVNVLRDVFGDVVDLKYIAKYCDGLRGGEIGLEKLAALLGVERIGSAHQAGSDSLLTALVHVRMKEIYNIREQPYSGLLYGISPSLPCLRREQPSSGLLYGIYPSLPCLRSGYYYSLCYVQQNPLFYNQCIEPCHFPCE